MSRPKVVAIILGGGKGTRLFPLTADRAKPAVPFAGKYRLVDIPISNCINSGYTKIYLLTQFNSASLHNHIARTYVFDQFNSGFVQILSAEQTYSSESWYQGTVAPGDFKESVLNPIEKENVYIELSSGNIDCAWGGLALDPDEIERRVYSRYGPYVENDIVVAVRANSYTMNKMMLTGKKMVMPSTPEAMAALNTDQKLIKRLGQITRLAGGTTECFAQLYAGKCDAVLTDSTALYYFNSH